MPIYPERKQRPMRIFIRGVDRKLWKMMHTLGDYEFKTLGQLANEAFEEYLIKQRRLGKRKYTK